MLLNSPQPEPLAIPETALVVLAVSLLVTAAWLARIYR